MDSICIESVVISPNPVSAGAKFQISVSIYSLYPATDLYPATKLYPGADVNTLFPSTGLYPEKTIYPTQGGMEK